MQAFLQQPQGRSREGAWIENQDSAPLRKARSVAPVRERGLKILYIYIYMPFLQVAPVRERGLKSPNNTRLHHSLQSLP